MAKKKAQSERQQPEDPEPIDSDETEEGAETKTCFIIMPFTDPDGYRPGHFAEVQQHLLERAIWTAGFKPDVLGGTRPTSIIHLDLIRKLHEAEMVLCDMSAANANVAFELGFRQAFDKPVALVKDLRTRWLFDTQLLDHHVYDESLRPGRLMDDVRAIAEKIRLTWEQYEGGAPGHSLVHLLQLKNASLGAYEGSEDAAFKLEMMRQLNALSSKISRLSEGERSRRDWANLYAPANTRLRNQEVTAISGWEMVGELESAFYSAQSAEEVDAVKQALLELRQRVSLDLFYDPYQRDRILDRLQKVLHNVVRFRVAEFAEPMTTEDEEPGTSTD